MLIISPKTAWHSWRSSPALAGKRRAQCQSTNYHSCKVIPKPVHLCNVALNTGYCCLDFCWIYCWAARLHLKRKLCFLIWKESPMQEQKLKPL